MNVYDTIIRLSKDTMKRYRPEKLKWMWGEALLMHSFALLETQQPDIDYTGYITRYVDHHIEKGYRIDQSDTLAPALAAYHVHKKTEGKKYETVVNKAIEYILHAPKVIENMPNHLGKSPEGKLYPTSIWVDSIMMYGVFTSLYADENDHQALMRFAMTQPRFFSKYLQDDEDDLFYHCYWTKRGHTYPKKKLFWGRGNGWVMAGLPMLIDHLPKGKERSEALRIYQKAARALIQYQRDDGFFETVLNRPGKTKTEASATALIGAGWLHGIRKGYLDQSFRTPAKKAIRAVTDSLRVKDGLLSMPNISAPTIPMPLFPYLGYKWTPHGNDWTYGLAALNFAAFEWKEASHG